MKTLVIDASIAVKVVIEKLGTPEALLDASETRVWVRFTKSRPAVLIGFVLPKVMRCIPPAWRRRLCSTEHPERKCCRENAMSTRMCGRRSQHDQRLSALSRGLSPMLAPLIPCDRR